MKVVGIVAAVVGALLAAAAGLIWMLALRVVGTKPRRKTVTVRGVGDAIELPRSELTLVDGNYGLWFGDRFEHYALVGPVVSADTDRVTRRIVRTTEPIGTEPFEARWTGHTMNGPAEIDPGWEDVTVPLRDGASAPAWLFRGASLEEPWVIHVQGIRTSRLVTLRSVEATHAAGLTSLVITYRGSGDGPPAPASTLGQREWMDLADAIAYARSCGAPVVSVVAWSMGAGLALELLRHDAHAIHRLALIAPATKWADIIENGVQRAGLPAVVASAVKAILRAPFASRAVGLVASLDVDRLDWTRDIALSVPTLVIHSRGDTEIPFELTTAFVASHPEVVLVEIDGAPHGWEANVNPAVFRSALTAWLVDPGFA